MRIFGVQLKPTTSFAETVWGRNRRILRLMLPTDNMEIHIKVEISNPGNYSERISFDQSRTIRARSFEDIAKIMSAFDKLFTSMADSANTVPPKGR